MAEADASVALPDQVVPPGGIDVPLEVVEGDPSGGRQHRPGCGGAGQGDERDDVGRLGVEPLDGGGEHAVDGRGDRRVAGADLLAYEERVAPGPLPQPLGVGRGGAELVGELSHLGDVEAVEGEHVASPVQRMPPRGTCLRARPCRRDHGEGTVAHAIEQVLEHPERVVVGPVEVVEDDEHGIGDTEHAGEQVDGVPPLLARRDRVIGPRAREPELGEDAQPQPERRRVQLIGPPAHELRLTRKRRGQLVEEAGLADARLAG